MLWTDPFFASFTRPLYRAAAFIPAADIAVSGDDLILTMDVPGMTVDDLSIEVQDGYLFVRGERTRAEAAEGTTYAHVERPIGSFERRIRVPKGTDPDRIMASLDNGVLSLIVPKPEETRPTTIQIATGSDQRELEPAAA